MKISHIAFAASVAATVVFSGIAQAAPQPAVHVIDFNDQDTSGPFFGNGNPFTTYSEEGFTVTAPAGQYEEYTQTPTPSLLTGYYNTTELATLTITGMQPFTFEGFDAFATFAGPFNDKADITVTGYSGGVAQFTQAISVVSGRDQSGPFQSYGAAYPGLIDSLTFQSDATFQLVIDNITLRTPIAAVPEPASWAMMIGGIGFAGGAMRRKRSVKVAFA